MATIEERQAELARKQALERANLEQEGQLLAQIPASVLACDNMAHIHKLYDRAGSFHVKTERYSSLKTGPDPTLETVRTLADAFPLVPVCVFRDGSVGIRTADDAEKEAEKRGERAEVQPIAPIWIEIEPASYTQTVSFRWVAQVGPDRYEMRVEFPLYSKIGQAVGRVDIRRDNRAARETEDAPIISQTFTPNQDLCQIKDSRWASIKYSSGNLKTPGHHLIFWDSANGEHGDVSVSDLIEVLTRKEGVK